MTASVKLNGLCSEILETCQLRGAENFLVLELELKVKTHDTFLPFKKIHFLVMST